MDEQFDPVEQEAVPEQEHYKPRPRYQVWLARIGVVIVLVAFLLYCWQIGWGPR